MGCVGGGVSREEENKQGRCVKGERGKEKGGKKEDRRIWKRRGNGRGKE